MGGGGWRGGGRRERRRRGSIYLIRRPVPLALSLHVVREGALGQVITRDAEGASAVFEPLPQSLPLVSSSGPPRPPAMAPPCAPRARRRARRRQYLPRYAPRRNEVRSSGGIHLRRHRWSPATRLSLSLSRPVPHITVSLNRTLEEEEERLEGHTTPRAQLYWEDCRRAFGVANLGGSWRGSV